MEQMTVGRIEFAPVAGQPFDKTLAELELRRKQMSRFPFCPDHRDKVFGLPCRECEIERLRAVMLRAAKRLERDGDEHGVAADLRAAMTPNVEHERLRSSPLDGPVGPERGSDV